MAYFDNKEHFASMLKSKFKQVEIATFTEEWPNDALQFWCAKCQ